MGYILKDIANILEPARLSLSGLPNFIQLSSKTASGTAYQSRITPTSATAISISLTDTDGGVRVITGTTDPEEVGAGVFFISSDLLERAENIKQALIEDPYIAANYNVFSDVSWNAGAPSVNGVIVQALANGAEFNLAVTATGATVTSITTGASSDTLKGEAPIVEIYVDLYREEVGSFLGNSDPAGSLGIPAITLSKSYNGAPVWFDLNGIVAQKLDFNTPSSDVGAWFDAGTVTAYRAMVRRGGYTNTPIYISDKLYALTGYGEVEEKIQLDDYAYKVAPIKLLTQRPVLPYIQGQREYITFLLGAPLTGKQVSILLRAYDGAGNFLASLQVGSVNTSQLNGVNCCAFNFDELMAENPTAVKLTAALTVRGALISNVVEYSVRPECLHKSKPFYFINRLGGWETFNFDGSTVEEVKPENASYSRTVTPEYDKAHGVEGLYYADIGSTYTVQGAPVSYEVAEWLKQMAAAKVVLDEEGRRVIVEDVTLRLSEGQTTIPVIKYRLSETYTNGY